MNSVAHWELECNANPVRQKILLKKFTEIASMQMDINCKGQKRDKVTQNFSALNHFDASLAQF